MKLKIIKNAFFIILIFALMATIFSRDWLAFAKGLAFGMLISILCFELLSASIVKSVNLPPSKAQKFVVVRYFIRLAIYAVVIFVSLKADYISIIGTIAGLSAIKLSIIIMGTKGGFK